MTWHEPNEIPPICENPWCDFLSISVLIKQKSGRFVVGRFMIFDKEDEEDKGKWIEDGRDSYTIKDIEKWAFIEE